MKQPITLNDLYRIVHIEDPQISPDGQWVAYVALTIDDFEHDYRRNVWLASTGGGDPIQLTRSGQDTQPRWSPDGKTLAFVSKRDKKAQIYLLPVVAPGGEPRQLTAMSNGIKDPAWSPDGTSIAFLSALNADERANGHITTEKRLDKLVAQQQAERRQQEEIDRWDPRIVTRVPYREGTTYLDDRFTQVFIISINDENAKPQRLTDLDANYAAPRWTTDSQAVITSRAYDLAADEPRRYQSLYRIALVNGTETQLTDNSHVDTNPIPSPDGQWIAYLRRPMQRTAERISRLTVIPTTANDEPRDLTLSLDRSVDDFTWTADSRSILFTAGDAGNIEIYRVSLAHATIEKIVVGRFEVTGFSVDERGNIAYSASTAADPSELYWQPANADSSQPLTTVNQAFLDEVSVQEVHEVCFDNGSGQEIQGWYLLPVDYEAGQQYPLAFNIHGGPQFMWGPSTPSMWHEWQLHAAAGYAVFYCNPRGSMGYGEAFVKALHGAWGDVAYQDLMAGIDVMLEKGFIDPQRMAVTGGSYGGYMTAWIIGHTDRFAAAVSQRGVYNLMSMYGVTDIPLFFSDQYEPPVTVDPLLHWQQSPLAYADNINTPLLIIHSENDFRVPISEGEQLFSFIKMRGGVVKFIRYPRDGHELSRSGEPKHRISRLQHMLDWFDIYCKTQ